MKKWIIAVVASCLVAGAVGYVSGYRKETTDLEAHFSSNVELKSRSEIVASLKNQRASKDLRQSIEGAIESRNYGRFRAQMKNGPWLSSEDLDRVLEWLGEMEDAEGYYNLFCERWAREDPDAAIEYAIAHLDGGEQNNGFHGIFHQLAPADPSSAFALWKETRGKLSEPLGIQGALLAITDAWWRKDPGAAMEAIQSLEDKNDRGTAVNGCFGESWQNANESERNRLLDAIVAAEKPEVRQDGIKGFAEALAGERSLPEMEDWLTEQPFEGELLAQAERGIAIQKLDEDGAEAARWLGARATEESLSGHLSAIVLEWASHEPNAAGEWLGTFPTSEKTDRATRYYANIVSHDDIESAFHWALQIQDGEKRLPALERFAKRWEKEDPGAVSRALTELDLDPSEAKAIESLVKTPPM